MMHAAAIRKLIMSHQQDIAFIIGNGVNRYPDNPQAISWEMLLLQLWDKVAPTALPKLPAGLSLTECYDLLELENKTDRVLQKEVTAMLEPWQPMAHHYRIVQQIRNWNVPLLTTNFDTTLARAVDASIWRTDTEGFTDFYPWSTYHGQTQWASPADGFGIWYINGMMPYHRSIRLGLNHYMGSVQRARNWLYQGAQEDDFPDITRQSWKGAHTWLQLLLGKSLFIIGLGLEEQEVFLRWLLIERMKYFRKFPHQRRKGWYLHRSGADQVDPGKRFFLERVGFELLSLPQYTDIYEAIWMDT